jgi:hypothetical protein
MTTATRFALALALGLWIIVGGLDLSGRGNAASAAPQQAAPSGALSKTTAAPQLRQRSALKTRLARKGASKAAAAAVTVAAAAATISAAPDAAPALPDAVANAHAQMPAQALESPPAASIVQAEAQLVASDQLNELDLAAAATPRPQAGKAPKSTAQTNSLWDQTSLIGKIFIAFGALLTVASAARLAIA